VGPLLPEDQGRDDDGCRICKDDADVSLVIIILTFQGVGLLGAVISIVLGNGEGGGREFYKHFFLYFRI
jgi:hypothetical protein